ncbi:hypothetical protein JKP88DRAFT_351206 [Tribonema minus]|uniref:Aminopeptidase n=1 Tax=Tribonema minus TaxID=303371 RepID=A0A835YII6_9STRA|nr:hypothetical protein JKP88DRAFT_351206 [Tribonema minus]
MAHYFTCNVVFKQQQQQPQQQQDLATNTDACSHCDLIVELAFRGVINDSGFEGLHFIPPDRPAGGKLLCSHMEPAHCRKVFPCLDLPHMKAIFELQLAGVPEGAVAVSNTPVRKEGGGRVTFEPTPLMSTYLLGKWCMDVEDARYALELTRAAFEFFSALFEGAPYPLNKLDLICVPAMRGIGMENYGAITLRQDFMLLHADAAFARRRRAARLVCHEVSHQWYGNLATPRSFDDLWLKEGLARYFEFVALDALEPSYGVWSHYVDELLFPDAVMFEALMADAQPDSHPVAQQHRGHLASVLLSFDTITYGKGASLLRMLALHIGHDVFMDGMRRLLHRHHFGSVTQDDLWSALQHALDAARVSSGGDNSAASELTDVKALMDGWLTRRHFPAVVATLRPGGQLHLRQYCFRLYDDEGPSPPEHHHHQPPLAPPATPPAQQDPPWHIPLQVAIVHNGRRHTRRAVMTSREMTLDLSSSSSSSSSASGSSSSSSAQPEEQGLVLNAARAGFFVSQYGDASTWRAALRAAAAPAARGGATEVEALGLVHDVLMTMMQGVHTHAAVGDAHAANASAARLLPLQRLQSLERALTRDDDARGAAWFAARRTLWDLRVAIAAQRVSARRLSALRAPATAAAAHARAAVSTAASRAPAAVSTDAGGAAVAAGGRGTDDDSGQTAVVLEGVAGGGGGSEGVEGGDWEACDAAGDLRELHREVQALAEVYEAELRGGWSKADGRLQNLRPLLTRIEELLQRTPGHASSIATAT